MNPPVEKRGRSAVTVGTQATADFAGRRIIAHRYRVDGLLAEGGMALVYRGWHVLLDQPIAIKVLREEFAADPEAVARFLREARVGAQLRGKHVAHVLDIGRTASGTPFLIMELLEGRTLGSLLAKRRRLAPRVAVRVLMHACTSVREAHLGGLVHRDLKPDNLFLTTDSEGRGLVKLLDFGIAKRLEVSDTVDTKTSLGSPHYMAPEQIVEPASVDIRVDVWSLGVILYELLTGGVPFDAPTIPEIFGKVMKSEPAPVVELVPGLPASLDRVIFACLSKARDGRIADTGELLQRLEVIAAELDELAPPAGTTLEQPDPLEGSSTELDIPVVVCWPESDPMRIGMPTSTLRRRRRQRRGRILATAALVVASGAVLSWAPALSATVAGVGMLAEYTDHARVEAVHWFAGYQRADSVGMAQHEPLRSALGRLEPPLVTPASQQATQPTGAGVAKGAVSGSVQPLHPPAVAATRSIKALHWPQSQAGGSPAPRPRTKPVLDTGKTSSIRSALDNHDLIDPYPDLK